ncbi:hypothetical protein EOD39_15549 [Acipenser ruthenus]|uniref:Uncharacterized protein n=1 Tax=Acipenser ruthenus TaxID=7906 RepID=A0A444V804_ACIRT|nr:hypothetical protein EOD39_15549 [Acipenser ruthenus]
MRRCRVDKPAPQLPRGICEVIVYENDQVVDNRVERCEQQEAVTASCSRAPVGIVVVRYTYSTQR